MAVTPSLWAQFSVVALIVGTAVGAGLMTLPLLTQGLPLVSLLQLLIVAALLMYQAALFWVELGQDHQPTDNLSSYILAYSPWLYWPTKIVYGAFFWTLLAFYLQNIAIFLEPFFAQTPMQALTIGAITLVGTYLVAPASWQGVMNNVSVQMMLLLLLDIFISGWNGGISKLPLTGESAFPLRLLVPMMMFFGYHLTIPSLKAYVQQPQVLKRLCAIGGGFVLLLYLCWSLILMGLIQQHGASFVGLNPQDFLSHLAQILPGATVVPYSANLFSVLAVLTSCFGMALGMRDFLQDIISTRLSRIFSVALTLAPSIFLLCLGQESMLLLAYAAHFALFLLLCVPSWLVYCKRSDNKIWPLLFCFASCSLFILL